MTVARSILGLLACAITSAHAAITADFPTLPDDSWYRVEIIVFERVADPPPSAEVLVLHSRRVLPLDAIAFDDDTSRAAAYPLDADTRALPTVYVVAQSRNAPIAPGPIGEPTPADRAAKAITDYESQLQARSYRPEPSNTYLLAGEDGRLQRSGAYRVLLHRAWIQPVPDRDRLQPMLIQIGEHAGGWRIEGYLGVTRGRYLHMDTQLWYAVNSTTPAVAFHTALGSPTASGGAAAQEDGGPGYMEMHEQRRMRSGELHYLDHPKFGVLARVDPVQPPDSLVGELSRLAALAGQPMPAPIPAATQ
jgi:hypothetical protein